MKFSLNKASIGRIWVKADAELILSLHMDATFLEFYIDVEEEEDEERRYLGPMQMVDEDGALIIRDDL